MAAVGGPVGGSTPSAQTAVRVRFGRYLDAIERLGYQHTGWEHSQRLTTAA